MKNKKVTIQQIADFTGLSKFAVSRALAGKPGVSSQTRDSILKAAGQLGYFRNQPQNQRAGVLVDPASPHNWDGTILVLFPNVRYQNRESLYWGPVFDGISDRLNQKGLTILTLTEPDGSSLFSLLKPEAIMGVITVGTVSTSILLDIKRTGIPVVMVDHLDPSVQCDSIFSDNLGSMREIVNRLVLADKKNLQFIGNIRDAQSFYERWLGFSAALADHQIAQQQIPSLISPEPDELEQVVLEAVAKHGLPDAYVCANDIYAQFTLEILDRHKIAGAEHIVMTGFDNLCEDARIMFSIDVDKALLGQRAVDQMLWRILNPHTSFERTLIQTKLVSREAARASSDSK